MGSRLRAALRRLRRVERRELRAFRRWIEDTRNLVRVSVLLFVPLLIGGVTALANAVDLLPFLLFPPLASGTYSLFARPESKRASPRRFVVGMTTGAACGWIAVETTARFWYRVPPGSLRVHAGAAAFGVLLAGIATWALDVEEPQAFSTALLVLVSGVTQLVYVASVFVSSVLVAGVFAVWRREVYEQRAEFLYQTTHGDDNVFVPMRGDRAGAVATFGARLAADHEAGKVVLFDVVGETPIRTGPSAPPAEGAGPLADRADGAGSLPEPARGAANRLDEHAARVEERFDVPCEVVVVTGRPDDAITAVRAARETNCDLIATPYESEDGRLSPFVRGLFGFEIDVVAVRTGGGRDRWERIMVPVRRPGDVAHAMLDFAGRLAGEGGRVTVSHCIDDERRRREAEEMLANLAETFERASETRVANAPIEEFLAENAANYDLTIVGSSTDRTAASRFIEPPTFRRLDDLDCDVAVVHRG